MDAIRVRYTGQKWVWCIKVEEGKWMFLDDNEKADLELLTSARRKLKFESIHDVDKIVGGDKFKLGEYPEAIRAKLRMLAGPYAETICKAMEARK